MPTGKGQILELILEDGSPQILMACAPNLVPSPGQFILASPGADAALPVPLFYTDSAPQGFIGTGSIPDSWVPGLGLYVAGPLGQGFHLPASARKVALLALDGGPSRLFGLIRPALRQNAAVVLLCDSAPGTLPDEVEAQPLSALAGILEWADFVAADVARVSLPDWREKLLSGIKEKTAGEAQILIHAPIPCGGIAECGICAVPLKSSWGLSCKDGPVFDWREVS